MGERKTDQLLVERVQQGDRAAYDVLVRKYQHKIVKLIGRYVRDQSDALDVAQEAFLKAYRALPKFRGDSAFYTWLYRIAINTAKNYLVSEGRKPVDREVDLQDPEQYDIQARLKHVDTPEGLTLTEEIRTTVEDAIQALPDDLRTAIVLRELEGMSYEEIAHAMDCPVGTVRSRIFRAREAISERLRPLLDH
jgi:RNA polymerase sigma-70 factor, ECF subfamily